MPRFVKLAYLEIFLATNGLQYHPLSQQQFRKAAAKHHHHVVQKAHSINQNARTKRIVGRTKKGVSGKFYKKLGLQTPMLHPDRGRGRGMSFAIEESSDSEDEKGNSEGHPGNIGPSHLGSKIRRSVSDDPFDSEEEEKSGGEIGSLVREFSSNVADGAVEAALDRR